MKSFNLDSLSFDEMTSLDAGANEFASGTETTGVSQSDLMPDTSNDPGFTTMWSLDV